MKRIKFTPYKEPPIILYKYPFALKIERDKENSRIIKKYLSKLFKYLKRMMSGN
jgi:hypothetical protein